MNSENSKPSSPPELASISLRVQTLGGMIVGLLSAQFPGRTEPDEMTIGTLDRAFIDGLPDPQAAFTAWSGTLSKMLGMWGDARGATLGGSKNLRTGDMRPEPGEPGHHITTLDGVEITTSELASIAKRTTNIKFYVGNNLPNEPLLHVLRIKHGDDLLDVVAALEEAAQHLRVIADTNQQRAINALKNDQGGVGDGQAQH